MTVDLKNVILLVSSLSLYTQIRVNETHQIIKKNFLEETEVDSETEELQIRKYEQ